MKNKLWDIANTIVERLGAAIKTNPKESKNFLKDISKEYWFDYLEEELGTPEPPTVRPMSELPEGNGIVFLAVLENDAGFRFLEVIEGNEYLYQGAGVDYTFTKKENFQNEHFKLIGWLYELPNPNEINHEK